MINLGEISKPASMLIEKVSDAIGGVFRPYQIRRIARAEADADKIRALAQIEVTEVQKRALQRFVAEEVKKQDNIESITAKALPDVAADADPSKMEDDWITNFFDKCRLISDEEMQSLWAKVLAGEANSPGKFSKRTVSFLGSLDKGDAELFARLCGFGCYRGDVVPLVYDLKAVPYAQAGLTFRDMKHLDEIGLISFDNLAGFAMTGVAKRFRMFYYGAAIDLEFPQDAGNTLALGKCLLSKVGQELAPICRSEPVDGFIDYLLAQWSAAGVICSSPFPPPTTA